MSQVSNLVNFIFPGWNMNWPDMWQSVISEPNFNFINFSSSNIWAHISDWFSRYKEVKIFKIVMRTHNAHLKNIKWGIIWAWILITNPSFRASVMNEMKMIVCGDTRFNLNSDSLSSVSAALLVWGIKTYNFDAVYNLSDLSLPVSAWECLAFDQTTLKLLSHCRTAALIPSSSHRIIVRISS